MNRIKECRINSNLSPKDVAMTLGVAAPSVSNWESGKTLPTSENLKRLSSLFGVSVDYFLGDTNAQDAPAKSEGVRIPVIGAIKAGIPISAIEEIEDWEEIPDSMARTGEYIALRVSGDSMESNIADGDIAILRRQETIENGQIATVLINGDEATLKQVRLMKDSLMLVGFNTRSYPPYFYSKEEIAQLPVRIYGRLVEVRRKF